MKPKEIQEGKREIMQNLYSQTSLGKFKEQMVDLYMTFVDLSKAINIVVMTVMD